MSQYLIVFVVVLVLVLFLCLGTCGTYRHNKTSQYQFSENSSTPSIWGSKIWISQSDPAQAYLSFENSPTPDIEVEILVTICDLVVMDKKFPAGVQLPCTMTLRKFNIDTSKPPHICPVYIGVRDKNWKILYEQKSSISSY